MGCSESGAAGGPGGAGERDTTPGDDTVGSGGDATMTSDAPTDAAETGRDGATADGTSPTDGTSGDPADGRASDGASDTAPTDATSPDTTRKGSDVLEDTTGSTGDTSDTIVDASDTTGATDADTPADGSSSDSSQGTDGTADTGDARDATNPASIEPTLIYVKSTNNELVYLDRNFSERSTGVTGDIRALGPSMHFDGDGIREIPYAIADGSGGPALKVVDLTGSVTRVDKNIMGYTNYGRLGVADVNNDGDLDIVYPNEDKALNYASSASSQTQIVKTGTNGVDAKPAAFMGAIDGDNNGREELYWIGTSSNVKYITQSSLQKIQFPSGGFHVGSNNNIGVGAPRDVNNDGDFSWAQINGSNNPGLVPETGGSFSSLNTSNQAVKAPIGFADVTSNSREEVVFVDTNGDLRWVTTKNPGTSSKLNYLKVGGSRVSVHKDVGVVSGTTAFRERLR